MKIKNLLLIGLVFISCLFVIGCNNKKIDKLSLENRNNIEINTNYSCYKFFTLTGNISGNSVILNAKVVSDNIKNIISPNPGIISYLNCNIGTKVYSKTLIAKIKPDFTDNNIKNLINQKQNLQIQLNNLNLIKNSTVSNFDIQINNLKTQLKNLNYQLDILSGNLNKLVAQKKYGIGDIDINLKSLEKQLKDLQKSKQNLINLKINEINKIKQSIINLKKQIKILLDDGFTLIDKIYQITDKYKSTNNIFQPYISAKNTAIKIEIKNLYPKLYNKNIDNLTGKNLSNYLQQVLNLLDLSRQGVEKSVSNMYLPKTLLDEFYTNLTNLYTNLSNLKTNFDNLIYNLDTINKNYTNQILNLDIQINNIKDNISNIKQNKKSSYISNIDVQINNTKSQIINLINNIANIKSQIKSLEKQKEIQINQLNNQIQTIETNLKNINQSLSETYIYANVNGIVDYKYTNIGNKIGPNQPICRILLNQNSLRLNIYSNKKIKYPTDIYFIYKGKKYYLKIISEYPTVDPVTKNYIYESSYLPSNIGLRNGENIKVFVNLTNIDNKIFMPVEFVINKIDGNYVYIYSGNNIIKRKILLGDIDKDYITILSGLNGGETICR